MSPEGRPPLRRQHPRPSPPLRRQLLRPSPPHRRRLPRPSPPLRRRLPRPSPKQIWRSKQAADLESRANEKAKTELASLRSGFSAKDLIAALNDFVINFSSDSAEVPATTVALLQNAADDLKQLPAGHVLEIAGYTDNTGNAAENIALSQRRADAVRDALIKDGANPDTLVAKGYGSADPIASNDTPEGRLRNRRIEYHILKTP